MFYTNGIPITDTKLKIKLFRQIKLNKLKNLK